MNVLSIDIDYAFSPTISLYDDFIVGSRIDYEEQQNILKVNNCCSPKLNKKKFKKLKKILKNFKNTSVVTIEHHHEIINHIFSFKNLHIQNIDHHHDIFYPGWHDLELLDEGNWVYHLSKLDKLKRYDWFRNKDSENFCNSIDLNFEFKEYFDLKVNYLLKPDIIFLCSSPHWTSDINNLLTNKLLKVHNEN